MSVTAVTAEMVRAHERSLRGSNGDIGVIAKQEFLEKEQTRQSGILEEYRIMLCDPEKGVAVQLKALNLFMESAQAFIDDFRNQTTRLIWGVAAAVLGGIILQLILNYVVTKGQVP